MFTFFRGAPPPVTTLGSSELSISTPSANRGDFRFKAAVASQIPFDAIFSPISSGRSFSVLNRPHIAEFALPAAPYCCNALPLLEPPIRWRLALEPWQILEVNTFTEAELHPAVGKITPIDLSVLPPHCRGRVYKKFVPQPLKSLEGQLPNPPSPDDDPFALLYFVLLAKKNWDLRVHGLNALLRAFPPGKTPFPYQQTGIKFLSDRPAALLADEMGLGKTVQAILAMRVLIHSGKATRVLVVCPKSLIPTWYQEITEWAPELSITVVHGPDKDKAVRRPHHVYISNYESVNSLSTYLKSPNCRPFDVLIVDEIQHLKNPDTRKAEAVTSVQASIRWGLSGTPMENRLDDYDAVWNVLIPGSLNRWTSSQMRIEQTQEHVLRREKSTVMTELPEKTVRVVLIDLDEEQRRQYDLIENQLRQGIEGSIRSNCGDRDLKGHVFAAIIKLKQLCIYDPNSKQSAKLDWILELLEEMHPDELPKSKCEKALIFTQYPNLVWDEWQLPRRLNGFSPLRYDGSLADHERRNFVQTFQKNEEHRLAFLGLKSGGTGLTLTRANHVVFLDQWWNPAIMDQAAARIHRIGQGRNCFVTALIARDTIDERIERLLARKREVFDQLMADLAAGRKGFDDIPDLNKTLSLDEMLEALGLKRATKGS